MNRNLEDTHCVSQIKYRSVCVEVRVPPHKEPRRIRSKSLGNHFRKNPSHLFIENNSEESRKKSQSESELREDNKLQNGRSKSLAAVQLTRNNKKKDEKNVNQIYKSVPYSLRISTYRPFECPMPFCTTLVCPSLLLQHLEGCHKELPSTPINLAGGNSCISSFDVYPRLFNIGFQKPSPVHLLKVNDGRHQPFGILFNLCWLKWKQWKSPIIPFGNSTRWLAAWVSCHYLLPIWFKLQFVGYTTRPSYLTFVCKSHEIKFKPTVDNVAQGSGVMLVNETTLQQYYANENALYVEVTTYLAQQRKSSNHCSR